ncbi:uncharacterized protein LOC120137754 [Hibiscus syriacus]|uniref:uncharacterized protein LOC120137754 n=1 Tax=Hibiscus syriacus TaxID=106335 RepID=UPI00192406AA|nr:uncharacterized protein LOC120137754 [Hibiscus syriacus]
MRLKTGNEKYVEFWNDVWLGGVPLKDLFPRLYVLSINKLGKVMDFRVNNASGWVWDIQMRRNLADWELEQWLLLVSILNNISLCPESQELWVRNIWVGIAPPRIETFVWQLAHQRVPVKEELLKRGVAEIVDPSCPLCGREVESVPHLFLHCEVVWGLWSSFLKRWNVFLVIPKLIIDFIILWDDLMPKSLIWKFIPRAVMWFNDVPIPLDSLVGDLKLADSMSRQRKACTQPTCWIPPPDGFLKLNVDGAMVLGWGKGGIGGLIRDSCGVLLQWFSESVGGGPPIMAELLAIKRGLCLMEDLGAVPNQRFILESDSCNALKWIKNPGLCTPMFQSLVKEIVSLLEGKDIIIRHVLRAANWEADKLAKDGIG